MSFFYKNILYLSFLFLLIFWPFIPTQAQEDTTGLSLDTIVYATGLTVPWSMTWAAFNRIFFSEIDGSISSLNLNDKVVKTLYQFEDLAREEQAGLMGIVAHPDFRGTGYLYAAHTYYKSGSNIRLKIVRLKYNQITDELNFDSELIKDIPAASSSTGTRLLITNNEKLLISVGDLQLGEVAQDKAALNGKILRFNLDGSIPEDNPNSDSPVWTYGHRNPQGLTQSEEGKLYSAEHGTFNNDELNLLEADRNYGWPEIAGFCNETNQETCDALNVREPLWAWSPTVAPANIAYCNGTNFAELNNSILAATLKDRSLRALHLNATETEIIEETVYLQNAIGRIRDVLVTPGHNKRIFVCTSNADIYGGAMAGSDQILELVEGDLTTEEEEIVEVPDEFNIMLDSTLLEIKVLAKNLKIPWDLVWGNDGNIWFSERNGNIQRMNPNDGNIQFIHHIDEVFESWDNSGLHGLALHPEFPRQPYIYAHYTYGYYNARFVRFTYDCTANTLVDSVHIISNMWGHETHNGSRIIFAPDQTLFLCTGDAYMAADAQDLNSLNGKILRMNADGSIPFDNPIPNSWVWSWGHRNPQGLVLATNGKLYNSEHGPSTDDEVNLVEKGRNYGWPLVKGYCNLPSEITACDSLDLAPALVSFTPTVAACGMDYYDHPAIPEWRNSLLLTTLKSGGTGGPGHRLKQIRLDETGEEVLDIIDFFVSQFGRIRDVLVAPDGRVFICTSNRETNGSRVVKHDDDKIIQIRNPNYVAHMDTGDLHLPCVQVHPVPAKEVLYLETQSRNLQVEVALFNVQGHVVYQQSVWLENSRFPLYRQGWPSGTYYLRLRFEDGTELVRKIVFG